MNVRSINLDQKIDFILDIIDYYSLRASIDRGVFLGKDLAFRMIMRLELLDYSEVLPDCKMNILMNKLEGVDVGIVINLNFVRNDCFNSFRHSIIINILAKYHHKNTFIR